MCASVRVCARVSQGGRANLYLVREREKKKRVKSDEGKSGRKKSNGGQKPTHANTHIHEGTHIENWDRYDRKKQKKKKSWQVTEDQGKESDGVRLRCNRERDRDRVMESKGERQRGNKVKKETSRVREFHVSSEFFQAFCIQLSGKSAFAICNTQPQRNTSVGVMKSRAIWVSTFILITPNLSSNSYWLITVRNKVEGILNSCTLTVRSEQLHAIIGNYDTYTLNQQFWHISNWAE